MLVPWVVSSILQSAANLIEAIYLLGLNTVTTLTLMDSEHLPSEKDQVVTKHIDCDRVQLSYIKCTRVQLSAVERSWALLSALECSWALLSVVERRWSLFFSLFKRTLSPTLKRNLFGREMFRILLSNLIEVELLLWAGNSIFFADSFRAHDSIYFHYDFLSTIRSCKLSFWQWIIGCPNKFWIHIIFS